MVEEQFFFVSNQWDFATSELTQGPRVPRETNMPFDRANKDPILAEDELT
jgi:hypothetical protein